MNQNYIKPDPWSIIEEGFDKNQVKSSESLFSIGNGATGQRANFEEQYSGKSLQGSYIAGVYYPDKTRVGWWKNGYPEYFAKVLNAPNWIGINVLINDEPLDLFNCVKVEAFRRELNMHEGWLSREFIATLKNGITVKIYTKRFLSLDIDELGAIDYQVTPLNSDAKIAFQPYIDAGIINEDSNWDDKFWDVINVSHENNQAFINAKTMKTDFNVCTFMESKVFINGNTVLLKPKIKANDTYALFCYEHHVNQGDTYNIHKFGGYIVDRNHPKEDLTSLAKIVLKKALDRGYNELLKQQKKDWHAIWQMADISIEGDVKAQQGIRFNIFQLNQTYSGKDSRLNIGPKGFTGEKYGGSTYWDTEAYCLPFYMVTKDHKVARNLLKYRYNHLEKAIENAEKIGFNHGAALFPMVTMNGEECHNEWEITFEEIHRNGAISYAIYNYIRYTGDYKYLIDYGLEVLIGVARFWHQRASFSQDKEKYVILGVTGPNEYENNVNNNFYTNYIARWSIDFALETIREIQENYSEDSIRIFDKTKLNEEEINEWSKVAQNLYLPFSEKHNVYLQQDGFLDKELIPAAQLSDTDRPLNQKWSWDKILRSPYIKQADTLQAFYFFEDHFSVEEIIQHFDFYEPLTVHESSLSPCVHSVLAAKIGRIDKAYDLYLQTSRLDLDDYNNEVEEGLHITSMAGTWMSIIEGFGGMRIRDNQLSFTPKIPKQWQSYTFKINFRGQILKVNISHNNIIFELEKGDQIKFLCNNKSVTVSSNASVISDLSEAR